MDDDYLYNIVTAVLVIMSIFWVVYSLLSTLGTECFDMFKAYTTIILLSITLIWNYLIKL